MLQRERLTELNIQELWLSHAETRVTVNSKAFLGKNLRDDGTRVELLFPFNQAKNEELTHIALGVDYEVQKNKPIGATKVDIAKDGTYSVLTQVPIKILSLESAVARAGNNSVQVCTSIKDGQNRAIALDPVTDRFIRSSDLKNKTIELFKSEAIYLRWIEVREKEVNVNVWKASKVIEEAHLKNINLDLTYLREGKVVFRRYNASVKYIPALERNNIIQPSNARRVTLFDLSLRNEQVLSANT